MKRDEFEKSFRKLLEALDLVKTVNKAQTDCFFEEFSHVDRYDFEMGCREMAFRTPGHLPNMTLFREAVSKAREYRLKVEADGRNRQAQQTWSGAISQGSGKADHPYFGPCCLLNIQHLILGDDTQKAKEAIQAIENTLNDESFQRHKFDWLSKKGLRPQDWLAEQLLAARNKWADHETPVGQGLKVGGGKIAIEGSGANVEI